jgi:hypothetical protein
MRSSGTQRDAVSAFGVTKAVKNQILKGIFLGVPRASANTYNAAKIRASRRTGLKSREFHERLLAQE